LLLLDKYFTLGGKLMNHKKKIVLLMVSFLMICTVGFLQAQATNDPSSKDFVAPDPESMRVAPDPSPETWGPSVWNIIWLPFTDFQLPYTDTSIVYDIYGYVHLSGGSSGTLNARIPLPRGAVLQGVDTHVYDNSASDFTVYVGTYYNYTSPTYATIDSWTLTGISGYGGFYHALASPHTIDPTYGTYAQGFYQIIVTIPDKSANMRFKGVKIYYSLQLSPAPGSATFNDVPTSHIFFSYVEALASSGITTGCTSTLYCPDNPVTRGQMAKFLSSALGLNWPF
jgi:hypothetical protein